MKIKRFECPKSIRNYEKKNTWNVRRLVNESFVPSAQRTSILYCRLSDFQFVSSPCWTIYFFRLVKRSILVKSKLRGKFLQILWPTQNILTLKGKPYCDRYFDANTEYDPTVVIKMKSKRLSKFLGPSFSYLTA